MTAPWEIGMYDRPSPDELDPDDWDTREFTGEVVTVTTEWRTVDCDGNYNPADQDRTLNELDDLKPDWAPFRIQSREVTEWTDFDGPLT